jgi:hypothetical protein
MDDPSLEKYVPGPIYLRQRAFIVLGTGVALTLIVTAFALITQRIPHNDTMLLAGSVTMVAGGVIVVTVFIALLSLPYVGPGDVPRDLKDPRRLIVKMLFGKWPRLALAALMALPAVGIFLIMWSYA